MVLYEEYEKAAEERLGISYSEIMNTPDNILKFLLKKYNLCNITNTEEVCAKYPPNRILHIVNLFLSKDFLFKKMFYLEFSEKYDPDEVSYEWDILALTHDLGYVFESKSFSADIFSVEDFCERLNVKNFFSSFSSPFFYCPITYTNYFRYKRDHFDVCDHGIVASLLLYNHYVVEAGRNTSLLDLAYIIASHNVFIANLASESMYRQYSLYELIPNTKEFTRLPAVHNRYAYYYLYLCLIDILEPINAFGFTNCVNKTNLLNTLSYIVKDHGLEITSCNGCYIEQLLNRIHNIAIWMNLKMIIHSPNRLELQIK